MKKFLGLAIIAFGVFLEVMWLGVCFGTIIIGILLLIFAPGILFFPFNFFLLIGLGVMGKRPINGSSSFKYQSYTNNQNSNSHRTNYTRPNTNNLSKYYEVLESKPTDGMDVIKKNYRRLIREYHYDSIASKDLPEDMVKFAEQKTKELNEAYSTIKGTK